MKFFHVSYIIYERAGSYSCHERSKPMDIKEKINEIVEKIKSTPALKADFAKDPEKTIEKLLGIDIPDGIADKIIDGVKAKLSLDKLGGIADKIKGLF